MLEGYRVIDFGLVWAGPLVGCILADLGAEVIKVESRKYIDSSRMTPDNETRDPEKDPFFHSINRNKLGITVDITHPRGISLLKQLVEVSDIVIENFSPGVMDRRGLGYDVLKEVNPRIVMIALPATGKEGALADVVTYGPSLSALAGRESIVGYPGERVLGEQMGVTDPNSAIHGAYAVLAGLYSREMTGKGQYIELAQMDTVITIMAEAFLSYTMNGEIYGRLGNLHTVMAPHNNYRCQGEDKWVSIAVWGEEEWRGFCQAAGNPSWTREEKFRDQFQRKNNEVELDKLVTAWTVNRTHYEAASLLQKNSVAAAPCLDIEERFIDGHFLERRVHMEIDHPAQGHEYIAGMPWKVDGKTDEIRMPAPLMGQHNRYVFGDLLKLPESEIKELVEQKILY